MIRKNISRFFQCLLIGISLSSGFAYAQFEKLVMPGRVVEAHADLEDDCGNCHERSADKPQQELCLACHKEVAQDVTDATGFHGRSEIASHSSCTSCHTDHEGRDADILGMNSGAFSHDFTDFPLHGSHFGVSCDGCHQPEHKFRDAKNSCQQCHQNDDIHNGVFGASCGTCHSDSLWQKIIFDHSQTDYPLTGAHQDAACSDCHQDEKFSETTTSCNSCHGIEDIHQGANGTRCSECHNTRSWKQLKFDHLEETGFALSLGHADLECQDCHKATDFKDDFSQGCVACHKADDSHQGRNGTACGDCHTTADWNGEYDHNETGFPLLGAHEPLICSACHKEKTDKPLSPVCRDCHQSDDVHAGQLGTDCASCHGQKAWYEDIVFDHDLTNFPLTGLHAATVCAGCHESKRFQDSPHQCVDCHKQDDPHNNTLGSACESCHNTNEWQAWLFDHNVQTDFPLQGSHEGLSCNGCHNNPSVPADQTPSTCASCHQKDDIHDGEFGPNCGRCHNARSFSEIDRL